MKRAVFALAWLIVSPASAAALSPDGIALEIKAHGAKAVVARLWKSGDWDRVMDKVDAGDGRWIALVPLLAPGADAGTAEELPIALAFALPHNPRAVLTVLAGKDGFRAEDVCSAPFIEDTVRDIPGYLRSAKAAVARVSDPALGRARADCLAQLRTAAAP